jgi:hypothetical protein
MPRLGTNMKNRLRYSLSNKTLKSMVQRKRHREYSGKKPEFTVRLSKNLGNLCL